MQRELPFARVPAPTCQLHLPQPNDPIRIDSVVFWRLTSCAMPRWRDKNRATCFPEHSTDVSFTRGGLNRPKNGRIRFWRQNLKHKIGRGITLERVNTCLPGRKTISCSVVEDLTDSGDESTWRKSVDEAASSPEPVFSPAVILRMHMKMQSRGSWQRWCRTIGAVKLRRIRTARDERRPWMAQVLEERTLLSTITVTSLADNSTGDGQVTLREAIEAANSNASVDGSTAGQSGSGGGAVQDMIVFQAGLTGTIALNPSLGELSITDSVKIVGLGSANTTVDAQGASRVFHISSAAGDVELDDMTITGGKTVLDVDKGGGISFQSIGALTLNGTVVTGNTTTGFDADGGGIFSDGGSVVLIGSTISNNSTGGGSAQGGGIYTNGGSISLTGSTVSTNSTLAVVGAGGGIYSQSGAITLLTSEVSGNTTHAGQGRGGGIYDGSGDVTLTDSTVSGNSTLALSSEGGGIYTSTGNVILNRSTISTAFPHISVSLSSIFRRGPAGDGVRVSR
jgi:CSLREA domain-containing protein